MSTIRETASCATAMEYRKRICAAMNFICSNLDRELRLEDIAASAAFSMYHFHRIFKAVVGETVADFTRRVRLELAANKLISSQRLPITDIAFDCGFSSSQNFAKTFRKHFGISPTEYRKSKKCHIRRKMENEVPLGLGYCPTDFIVSEPKFIPQGGKDMHAKVENLPELLVAYARKLGPYGQETCERAFADLLQWAGAAALSGSSQLIAVYWDNPELTPAEKCRTDACLVVDSGVPANSKIGLQTLAGGPYGVCRFEITAEEFPKAWEDAFSWVVSSGYECRDSPCYEMYHNDAKDHPQGKWLVDICIPLDLQR